MGVQTMTIVNTERLVADGIITDDQARAILARARESMVYLAINTLLFSGIIVATTGLIALLGTPSEVAAFGIPFFGIGLFVLVRGNEMYRMFGNASALIGAGMLVGGASLHWSYFGAIKMVILGLAIAAVSAWLFKAKRNPARFVTGAIILMGLAMHLHGIALSEPVMRSRLMPGVPISVVSLYATAAIIGAGWLTDVRLVTALAIIPFAQALSAGTFYNNAAYVFYSKEPTLSIIQMALLISVCIWVSSNWSDRTGRHARTVAVMAFIVANLCALVGSLNGDFVNAVFISESAYSILWALALAVILFWAASKAQRGLLNAALTFGGIHAYTQFFESYWDEPMAYVIGGLAAIPLAWGMWRLNRWAAGQEGARGSDVVEPTD